jgi:hypothetical protein
MATLDERGGAVDATAVSASLFDHVAHSRSLDRRGIITVPFSSRHPRTNGNQHYGSSSTIVSHAPHGLHGQESESAVAKEEEELWITRWDCARLCQELDEAQDFLSAIRMQIGSTEVAVDHLRRDVRAQEGGADRVPHDPSESPADVAAEREGLRLRETIAALTARQQAIEVTRTAAIAQVTEGRRSRALAASRYRWRLSHIVSDVESTRHRILHAETLREFTIDEQQRQDDSAQHRFTELQARIDHERRLVYEQDHKATDVSDGEPRTSPHAILLRSVEKAQHELRALDAACLQLEEEGRSLEATTQLGVSVVLSQEQELRLEHLYTTKHALVQALQAADAQHLKVSADLDAVEGQLLSCADIIPNAGESSIDEAASRGQDVAHHRVMSDDWRRRLLDQLTALRQRLKQVRDASRHHRERRQAGVIKTKVHLPAALKVSSAARVDQTAEGHAAIFRHNDALDEWSAQLNAFVKKLDVERRTHDHLLSREAQLIEEIENGRRQLQTIDGLVAAYRAASSQLH